MPSSKSDVKFNVVFNLEYLHFILIATQRRIILTPQRFERTFRSIQAVDGAGYSDWSSEMRLAGLSVPVFADSRLIR